MSKTTNYSRKRINEVIKNFEFLENSTTTSEESFCLNLRFDPILQELHRQAMTFSMSYSTHGYINFFKVLQVKQELVESSLYELYIYSFCKCAYNGIYFHNISGSMDLGSAFSGHANLFNVLKSRRNSGNVNQIYLSYSIDVGTESEKQALFAQLFAKFKFLSKYRQYSTDRFGTHSFFIKRYESFLNRLTEDFYSSSHIQQGEKTFHSDNRFSHSDNLKYENGKLEIEKLDSKLSTSINSFDNSPFMNSFYSEDKKILFYHCQ
jgi:hypothetical protein